MSKFPEKSIFQLQFVIQKNITQLVAICVNDQFVIQWSTKPLVLYNHVIIQFAIQKFTEPLDLIKNAGSQFVIQMTIRKLVLSKNACIYVFQMNIIKLVMEQLVAKIIIICLEVVLLKMPGCMMVTFGMIFNQCQSQEIEQHVAWFKE